ncbi:MAG TPA: 1-(5-phosphoribosyl)-5-[(5-phosphoribosylamino)methylideneamino]imidazole-4-carboxamide isomerase [Bacteroidota bacterium]|nr:1-(5-phosphoribosyl)-5-[(5-phosphoribosylamino)methylideneamino]imidazole-4-carboxamide isomerase [Bacteroidota bacterium]
MFIIPAIDIIQNSCVRLTEGSYASVKNYTVSPEVMAKEFLDAGATYLHVVDLEGAKKGTVVNWNSLLAIRKLKGITLQFGGGVRSDADVIRLIDIGVDRIIVGSIALLSPNILQEWIDRFGSERFCIALDFKDGTIATHGWQKVTQSTYQDVVPGLIKIGVKNFLSTDIRKDGMMNGPNFELYKNLVSTFPSADWFASGGVHSLEDICQLKATGVTGAIIGKALYEGTLHVKDILEIQC